MVAMDQREGLVDFPVVINLLQIAEAVTQPHLPCDTEVSQSRNTRRIRSRNSIRCGEIILIVVGDDDLLIHPRPAKPRLVVLVGADRPAVAKYNLLTWH